MIRCCSNQGDYVAEDNLVESVPLKVQRAVLDERGDEGLFFHIAEVVADDGKVEGVAGDAG